MAFFLNLPQEQTVGSALGAGLGQGIAQGAQTSIGESLNQYFQQRKLQKETSNLQKTLNTLSPEASLTDKFKAIATAPVSADTKKLYFQSLQQEGAQKFADKLRSGQQMSTADVIEGAALGYIPPGAEVELLRGVGGTREREQAGKLFQKEHEQVRKEGLEARNLVSTIRQQRTLLEKGNFGPFTWDNLLMKIGLPGAASSEAQAFQGSLLNFMGGQREKFGVRLTDADLRLIQDKLPGIARTKEGNDAILKMYESETAYKELRQRAYDNIYRKNKGYTYDFSQQVEDEFNELLKMHPDIEELYRSSTDTLKNIAQKEENLPSIQSQSQNIPENYVKMITPDGKVKAVNPKMVKEKLRLGYKKA